MCYHILCYVRTQAIGIDTLAVLSLKIRAKQKFNSALGVPYHTCGFELGLVACRVRMLEYYRTRQIRVGGSRQPRECLQQYYRWFRSGTIFEHLLLLLYRQNIKIIVPYFPLKKIK